MVRIAFEVLLNPLQVFASMLGSFLVAMVMRVDILGVVGKGNRYSVERKKEVVVVDRLLVRTDLEEDEFWEEEDSEEELDYSDAVVWLKLEELRRKMTRERLEGVDVGGEKVEEGKKDEEEERERWRLLEEEEKRKEQVRKLAEKEASLLLEGDVVPPKNEKAIIRDLFMMLKRGGSDGGQKKSPLLRQEHSHKTVFNEVVRKFQLVEVRGKERHIEIHTFSNAVLELTNAIDALGGWLPVQSFIRTDIINNVRKVNRGCQKANTETLQEMVYTELDQNVDFYESGREALLWLKRTLQFVRRMMLYCLEYPDSPLSDSIQRAYREALAPCHNWAVRPIMGLCLRTIPNRSIFLQRLGSTDEDGLNGIDFFLESCNPVIGEIVTFFNETKLEDVVRLEI